MAKALMKQQSLAVSSLPQTLSYLGSFLESLLYYAYYVTTSELLERWLTKIWSSFGVLPEYYRHIIVAFSTTTLWQEHLAQGFETYPDTTILTAFLHRKQIHCVVAAIHVIASILGAAFVGLLFSSTIFEFNLSSYLKPSVPPYIPVVVQKSSLSPVKASSLSIWGGCSVKAAIYSEIFFSFINCFTNMVLLAPCSVGQPNRSKVVGMPEVKRYVNGTVIYLGKLCIGVRPTLHLAYTALTAVYYRNLSLFIIFGTGNLAGLILAAMLFEVCHNTSYIQISPLKSFIRTSVTSISALLQKLISSKTSTKKLKSQEQQLSEESVSKGRSSSGISPLTKRIRGKSTKDTPSSPRKQEASPNRAARRSTRLKR